MASSHCALLSALAAAKLALSLSLIHIYAKALGNGEARLRYLFVMALNALPYVKKGMVSSYRDELEQFLVKYVERLFEQACDEEGLYQNCTRFEVRLILRYHSQAIIGILRNWTDADTKNLDLIVHTVFRLMTEGIAPRDAC